MYDQGHSLFLSILLPLRLKAYHFYSLMLPVSSTPCNMYLQKAIFHLNYSCYQKNETNKPKPLGLILTPLRHGQKLPVVQQRTHLKKCKGCYDVTETAGHPQSQIYQNRSHKLIYSIIKNMWITGLATSSNFKIGPALHGGRLDQMTSSSPF